MHRAFLLLSSDTVMPCSARPATKRSVHAVWVEKSILAHTPTVVWAVYIEFVGAVSGGLFTTETVDVKVCVDLIRGFVSTPLRQ